MIEKKITDSEFLWISESFSIEKFTSQVDYRLTPWFSEKWKMIVLDWFMLIEEFNKNEADLMTLIGTDSSNISICFFPFEKNMSKYLFSDFSDFKENLPKLELFEYLPFAIYTDFNMLIFEPDLGFVFFGVLNDRIIPKVNLKKYDFKEYMNEIDDLKTRGLI